MFFSVVVEVELLAVQIVALKSLEVNLIPERRQGIG